MKAINFICFQVGWYFCITLGADYRGEQGAALMLFFTLAQVCFLPRKIRLLSWLFLVTLIGTLLDMGVWYLGAFDFLVPSKVPWPYPVWMSALWLGFGLVIDQTLSWMSRKVYLSGLFGFFGGAVSYYIGHKLGAIVFPEGIWFSLGLVGCFWMGITPVLFWIHRKILPGPESSESI